MNILFRNYPGTYLNISISCPSLCFPSAVISSGSLLPSFSLTCLQQHVHFSNAMDPTNPAYFINHGFSRTVSNVWFPYIIKLYYKFHCFHIYIMPSSIKILLPYLFSQFLFKNRLVMHRQSIWALHSPNQPECHSVLPPNPWWKLLVEHRAPCH